MVLKMDWTLPPKREPIILEDHAEMVTVLGDGRCLSEEINERLGDGTVTRHQVSMWKSRGNIPLKWRGLIRAMLQERGFDTRRSFTDPLGLEGKHAARSR